MTDIVRNPPIDGFGQNLLECEHRINYGRLWPDTLYKADCSCGWSFGKASRESVVAAVRDHEEKFL